MSRNLDVKSFQLNLKIVHRQMEYEHDVATSVAESNAEVFKVCLGQKYDRLSALAGGQNVVPQLGNWVITLQQFRTFGLAP